MEQASSQRAREAANKEAQRGTTTAGTKWGEREIERFKEALARLGPSDNAKLAEAVGTRDKAQVSAFKCRFLKKHPTWLKDHCPPGRQAALNTSGSPTPSPTSSQTSPQATEDHHPPSTRMGNRARPADTRGIKSRNGRTTASPVSPTPTPPDYAPPASTGAPPSTTWQYSSPEGEAADQSPQPQEPQATASQEVGTPSPQPAPISTEAALKLQRLDQALDLLRSNRIEQWEPAPRDPSSLAHDSTSPHAEVATSTTPEWTAPPPTPTGQEGEQSQLNREAALAILTMDNIELWDPEEEMLSPTLLAGIATPPSAPSLSVTEHQQCRLEEGDTANRAANQLPLQLATSSTPPPARATKGQRSDLEEDEVDFLLQELTAPREEALAPPPTTLVHHIDAQPFIPGVPWTAVRTRQSNQGQQAQQERAVRHTSSPPTPHPSPQNTSPPARVSERQHHSLGVNVTNPLPPLARARGAPPRISIDPDRMDETLRHPFHTELTPFITGRHLGDFEWVAFEETLQRWSTAIKEVVTAQRRRPPNPTSQWSRRRRRREQETRGARSPTPTPEISDDPSQPSEEQDQGPTNNRASGRARRAAKARRLQKLYRANPGVCMRQLLDNTPRVYCAIAEPELVAHFTTTFTAPPPLAPPPTWLFTDRHPGNDGTPGATVEGDVLQSPITPEDVVTQFKRSKRTAPGADGISYSNWRWVDPLGLILSTIYNICRINSRIPHPWKHSTVTLIHKGGDVTSVRNWRPISLQLTVYKLYSAIIARRIASWAIATSAFSEAQKGFLAYDGCAEHNFMLRSMMTDSRRRRKDALFTWLDLRDAFGSVPHELMLLLMKRLGLAGTVIRDIYSHSTIAVRTGRESYTPAIPQNRGVKQGCPLSPILFNIALEGLLKHLSTSTAGYAIAGYTINALAYADDVCVIATTKPDLQGILDRCKEFADWAGLAFNAKKCGSLYLVNHTSRLYVDHLYSPHLGTDPIPALSWEERYKYLGCPTGAYRTPTNILNDLRDNLIRDTGTVFSSQLAEWQKLDAFRRFLFPRLCFIMKVIFPGTVWCRKLDTVLRTTIKRGLHLPPRTCTKYLYLSQALGGLGVPSAEDESHVSRAAQAFKYLADTRDRRIRGVALDQLSETVAKRARQLDHTTHEGLHLFLNSSPGPGEGRAGDLQTLWSAVRNSLVLTNATICLSQDSATISIGRHKLSWDKRKLLSQTLKTGLQDRHLAAIKASPDQGRAFDSVSLHPDSTFFTYTGAFLSFPQYRFIHRARLNLLPVRTVQARSRRPVTTTQCRTCGRAEETLAHIINHCHYNLGMVRDRHNAILERIVRAVPDYVGTKMKEQAIPGTTGNNRPDLTITSPDASTVFIVEVSCPFEGSPYALEDAAKTKLEKYEPLKQQLLQQHQQVYVYPFIVGSLGSWYPENDRVLSALHIGHRYAALMRRLCVVSAIAGSQNIWYQAVCKRDHHLNQTSNPLQQPAM